MYDEEIESLFDKYSSASQSIVAWEWAAVCSSTDRAAFGTDVPCGEGPEVELLRSRCEVYNWKKNFTTPPTKTRNFSSGRSHSFRQRACYDNT